MWLAAPYRELAAARSGCRTTRARRTLSLVPMSLLPRSLRLALMWAATLVVASVLFVGPGDGVVPSARAAATSAEDLRRKIASTEQRVQRRRSREGVLTADLRRYGSRMGELQGRINALQSRQGAVQRDLDTHEVILDRTQRDLRTQRQRLMRLRAQLRRARRVLAARLVELYQADKPDLIGVVVSSRGFADLIERGEFLARIGRQDQTVMRRVRAAKSDASALASRLSRLERTQRSTVQRISSRRDEIARVKRGVISAQRTVSNARARRAALLRTVRQSRRELEGNVASLERQESKVRARLEAARLPASPSGAAPPKRGNGRLVWPADGQFTSPFGPRWGRLHAGIDIAVPTGTPVRAADSGTVVIAGWTGGYGNYVCVDTGGGLTVCGAHNSQIGVRVGQRVAQGQVIARSGNTGNSTGPHVHFETRVGGVLETPWATCRPAPGS